MKTFIIIFFLIFSFQILTKADDVRNYEIADMSVGDSLLKYKNKENIEKYLEEKLFFPGSKNFFRISFPVNDDNYDFAAAYLKNNDKKYIIYALEGLKYISYSKCKSKMKSIKKDMELDLKLQSNSFQIIENELPHTYDPSKESMVKFIDFINADNYTISRIICTDWSKRMEKDDFFDSLAIYLQSKEFSEFMLNDAY